ncbi:MAG: MBL fold metallo-hydrolase [Anaerolineae bacterium]
MNKPAEIAPGVYWLTKGSVNLYLCDEPDGLTLIDAGMPKQQDLVWEALADLGKRPSDLVRILITHADIDHAGGAAAIQEKSGAAVFTSAATSELLKRGDSPQHLPWLMQFVVDHFMGYGPVSEAAIRPCQPGDDLSVLGGLQVLATPGHTMDHISFYNPTTGILFAGDALQTRNNKLALNPKRITADMETAVQSGIKLLEWRPHAKPRQR